MTADEAKLLQRLCRGRSKGELKMLFALVRANTDRVLMASLKPKKKPVRRGDPLAKDIERIYRPIMAASAEKADLLVEHMSKKLRRQLGIEPKGLADAVKRLRTHFTEAEIRAGAEAQVKKLSALYGKRETVV